MILVPEIETVIILVPRTGTLSMWRAITSKYPKAMLIYRHMEADGVPLGYDTWRRVGVVRHPVDRLWSLYKFLQDFGSNGWYDPAFAEAMRDSVKVPFNEWLLKNQVVFATGDDLTGLGPAKPQYAVRHALPETRKSQRIYLRPDLGTEVFRFDQIDTLAQQLEVELPRLNATGLDEPPTLDSEADAYLRAVFAWDFSASAEAPAGRALSLDYRKRQAALLELVQP